MKRVLSASARAFVVSPRSESGGNPVSIFLSSRPTTPDERTRLAQSCSWESVVIENEESDDGTRFHFFMPSGEEVSFCGHAAIGACSFLANKQSVITNEANSLSSSVVSSSVATTVPFLTAVDGLRYDAIVDGNEAELVMNTQHEETECNNSLSCSLEELLSEIGLSRSDVPKSGEEDTKWPTYINSSVARPKTLIPVSTTERLHAATPPRDPDKFRDMCDTIHSTGIYLYSKVEAASFECRQFPRGSGYPEDPATGIAAGALAASLHKRQYACGSNTGNRNSYDMYQGTAMGRPSKIGVKIDDYAPNGTNASLRISYTGLVVFDSVSHLDL